jgi:signal transduction histidine kinase
MPKRYFAVHLSMRLLLAIALLTATALRAQFSHQLYTPANGLVDTRLEKFFQDSRGVMYFLTREGFSSFDGQRFRNYTHYGHDALSIVSDIWEEPDGRMLLVSISGIYHLQNHVLYKDTVLYKASKEPGSLFVAATGERIISANSGTVCYGKGKPQPLTNGGQPLVPDQLLGTGDWLLCIESKPGQKGSNLLLYNWRRQQLTYHWNSMPNLMLRQYHGQVYLRTGQGWGLLNGAALAQGKLLWQPLPFTNELTKHAYDLLVDAQGLYWLLLPNQRIASYDPARQAMRFFTTADGFPAKALAIFQDREHNFWFAVEGQGVQKTTLGRMAPYNPFGNGPAHVLQNRFTATADGRVVFQYGDTVALQAGNGFVTMARPNRTNAIQVFFWNGQWWNLYANGRLENESGTALQVVSFAPGTKQLSANIGFDRQGRLLIAGNYLIVVDGRLQVAVESLPQFADNVACDGNNDYWCFIRNGQVLGYRWQGQRLVGFADYRNVDYSARYAMHWGGDSFCIGTRNRGIVFVRANGQGHRLCGNLSVEKGIGNNFVTSLLRTGPGQLLAGTVSGLDLVHLGQADTAVEQVFSRAGLFTGVSGSGLQRLNDTVALAMAFDGALYTVQTRKARQQAASPQLFFSQVTANGADLPLQGPAVLPHHQNNLRFWISAPSFVDEKNIRFVFELKGPGTAAVQNARRAEFEYANLLPGEYTLTVTAHFPGDPPMSKTIAYTFTIRQPFWKTMGFVIGAVVLGLLLLYALFRALLRRRLLRQRIALEKQEAIAHERTRIASDMHDELGAGISTIKYLSQSAPFIAPEVQRQNNLKIAAQADALVDQMNDIIWAMNERNDTLDNLVFYAKAWVAAYSEGHGLEAHIGLPGTIEPIVVRGEKRQHIFMCVKESLHNIVKHAGAKQVWLDFSYGANQLRITIRDDGKGFDSGRSFSGNGLANMRKRMQAVGGTMQTTVDNGTEHRFTVPL